jgi:hypothetical protein
MAMALKSIGFSFCICILITLIFVNVFRPNSSVFFPSFILQLLAYVIMLICAFIIGRTQISNSILTYTLSFIVSYFLLILILWRINSGNIFETIIEIHKGKDFMLMIFPFISSNILMLLYILFSKK